MENKNNVVDSHDLLFKSTYDNIKLFIKGRDIFDLLDLCDYVSSTHVNTPPNDLQKEFIEEFFGHHEWAEFVNSRKFKRKLFSSPPSFDFENIQGILQFEVLKLSRKSLLEKNHEKLQFDKLKLELQCAQENSYYPNHKGELVFDKVDGFGNIFDVLVNYKLCEYPEED